MHTCRNGGVQSNRVIGLLIRKQTSDFPLLKINIVVLTSAMNMSGLRKGEDGIVISLSLYLIRNSKTSTSLLPFRMLNKVMLRVSLVYLFLTSALYNTGLRKRESCMRTWVTTGHP